ncbi:MAG: response regulator [Chloroflexota bacterium]|nr:response regulator [Chloroflexota bacterium]
MEDKPRILIVDDDENLRRSLSFFFRKKGYETETAGTGREALEKAQSKFFNATLLDICLPDMEGIELLAPLKEMGPHMEVILITGYASVETAVRALNEGASAYITKPLSLDEVFARVEGILARARQAQPVKRGKVLGFIGVKGGVGTTTVALNVASALAQQEKAVVAVELMPCYGTFAQQLRWAPLENLGGLLELDAERIDERELGTRLFKSPSGLGVLFGPQKADEFKEIEPDQAEAIIKGLAGMADYTIIDLPRHPSSANRVAVQCCDFVTLVVAPKPSCVMSGRVTLEVLKSWGVSGGLVGAIVVNRAILARAMKVPEIRSRLGCEIVGLVPPAAEACMAAQERGVPLVLYQPNITAAVALTEIASRLAAGEVIAVRS